MIGVKLAGLDWRLRGRGNEDEDMAEGMLIQALSFSKPWR